MEIKKLLFVFVFAIFILGSVSALTYKQNTEIDLNLVCINAGYCSASAVCNVSVFSPSGSVLLDGVQATQAASLANYNVTIGSGSTSELGEYQVGGFCKDGSVTQVIDFAFDVTQTGSENISNFLWIFLAIIVLTFLLGVIFENNWIVFFGFIELLFFGFFIMIYGIDVLKTVQTTRAVAFIVWGVSIIGIFRSVEGMLSEGGWR